MINLLASIGLIFGGISALAAFLITYNEYQHHYSNKRDAIKEALKMAFFAFLFFMLLSLFIGWFFNRYSNNI